MRNNTRHLLSIPALAIATIAFSTANVNAQCPGGCFGYPTPSQPASRSYAPAQYTEYRPAVQVFQAPTFVQEQSFASAPQFAPIESYAPVQSFAQPQQYIQPQFAPAMMAPIEQTFTAQPAIVMPMQTIDTPQYFPQYPLPALPTDNYSAPQSGIISSGQIVEPMVWNSMGPIVSPTIPDSADMSSETEQGETERVQEGQIEGEIISSEDDSSVLETTPEENAEPTIDKIDSPAKRKSDSTQQQEDVDDIPLLPAKDLTAEEEAEKAEMKQAAEEKATSIDAERLEAEKAKAAKMELEKKRAAELKAAKLKAAEKKKAKSDAAKIKQLETSMRRQISRANQVAEGDLSEKLTQLETDGASDEEIAAAEKEAAVALEKKIKTIQARIKARIDKVKNPTKSSELLYQ